MKQNRRAEIRLSIHTPLDLETKVFFSHAFRPETKWRSSKPIKGYYGAMNMTIVGVYKLQLFNLFLWKNCWEKLWCLNHRWYASAYSTLTKAIKHGAYPGGNKLITGCQSLFREASWFMITPYSNQIKLITHVLWKYWQGKYGCSFNS